MRRSTTTPAAWTTNGVTTPMSPTVCSLPTDRIPTPNGIRPLRFLEIGVAEGGSLGVWRRFFGSEATVCGVDIDPTCAGLVCADVAQIRDDSSARASMPATDEPAHLGSGGPQGHRYESLPRVARHLPGGHGVNSQELVAADTLPFGGPQGFPLDPSAQGLLIGADLTPGAIELVRTHSDGTQTLGQHRLPHGGSDTGRVLGPEIVEHDNPVGLEQRPSGPNVAYHVVVEV